MERTILCVDPDETARSGTAEGLRADLEDVAVETAGTLSAARAVLSAEIDAVVTEYDLPDGTGVELVRAAREASPDAACILYTDADPDAIDTDALRGR